jgi:predicted RNase H-like HicB family nuclease
MQRINIIYWQEEDGWLGYLPEYPDYWTQGDTLEDLRGQALVVLLAGVDKSTQDRDIATALALAPIRPWLLPHWETWLVPRALPRLLAKQVWDARACTKPCRRRATRSSPQS